LAGAAGRSPFAVGRWPFAVGRWPVAVHRSPFAVAVHRSPVAGRRWRLALRGEVRTSVTVYESGQGIVFIFKTGRTGRAPGTVYAPVERFGKEMADKRTSKKRRHVSPAAPLTTNN
jgi:hypothetical protein